MPPVVDHSYSRPPTGRRSHLPAWCSWPVPGGEKQEVDTDGLAEDLDNLGLGMEAEDLEDWEDLHEPAELSPARRKSTLARMARDRARARMARARGGLRALGRGGLARGGFVAGAVRKHSLQKSSPVEVLKFRSVRLEGDKRYLCPLAPCTFSCSREDMRAGRAAVHLTQEHSLKVERDTSSPSTSSYCCPLPACPFLTSRQGLLCGHAAIHLVREHGLGLQQVLASSGPRGVLRFRRREEARGRGEQQELEQLLLTLKL